MSSSKELLLEQREQQNAASISVWEIDPLFNSFQALQEKVEAVMSRLGRDHPEYDNLFDALVAAADDTTRYLKNER